MFSHDQVVAVLAAYPPDLQPEQIEDLGSAGGFSGARFWRLTIRQKPFCLRRWPVEHPTPQRLQAIHAVLRHSAAQGMAEVPAPSLTVHGESFLRLGGHLWELTPWLPGAADFRADPRPAKLAAALRTLARFHQLAAEWQGSGVFLGQTGNHCLSGLAEEDSRPRASPGLVERCEFLSQLREGGHQQLLAAIRSGPWPGLDERARRLLSFFPALAPRLHAQLIDAGKLPVPLQPCIRDIWHDHVLFTGDEVTGLIDFGAMRPECVATDIARLLGSLLLDDADGWRLGLASYQEVRPLSSNELHLVGVFDHSATLLSGLNWLRWIFLEGRQFADATRILARLDETLRRLQVLAERGARS